MIDFTNKKTVITAVSIVAAIGVGYFIYNRIRINALNKQVSSPEEMIKKIRDIKVSDTEIEDTPVDPNKLPDVEFDDNRNPISRNQPPDPTQRLVDNQIGKVNVQSILDSILK